MNIVFKCSCGKSIVVKGEMAGRTGKCPACGGPVVVPKPPTAGSGLLADESPALKPPADAVPAGCPTCGARFEPGAVICVRCGTDLVSGARIRTEASHAPIVRKTPERAEIEAEETRPFWRLALGAIGKPGVTFASMPIQLSSATMIAKMLVFYFLSVVIYAMLASRGFAATPRDLPLGVIVIVMFAPVDFFITALLINLGARMWMGSKGNFLLFLVVMAFATAVVNFGSVPLVLITPLIGAKTTSVTAFALMAWRVFLYYEVLTKVYDADFMEALAIVVIAFMIQWFITMWLFASLLMFLSTRFQG